MKRIVLGIALISLLVPLSAQSTTDEQDPALFAVGSLGASNLYLSYLVLGTVADGFVNGSYEASVSISVAREAMFLNSNAQKALEDLLDDGVIGGQDSEIVRFMVETYGILNQKAQALINFIQDETDGGELYRTYRAEAWARISQLLRIE